MSTTAGQARKRRNVLLWRGVLDGSDQTLRLMVAIVLAVAGATGTFTQLGFVALESPSGTIGYVIVLLQVVALGALLLGTVAGTALGFVTGGVLLLHSHYLPLDFYELSYVTPITSVVMFGISGLILGILFAFVLRNDPPRVKRIIYITIVCVVVSWLYSVGFIFSAFMALIIEIAQTFGADASLEYVQELAGITVFRFGSLSVQAWSTAFVMALLCSIGDFVAYKVKALKGTLGLRSVFGAWLAVVVSLAFMTMSAASFAVFSADELRDAEETMRSAVNYLSKQVKAGTERENLINSAFEQGEADVAKIDDATIDQLTGAFGEETLLEKYSVEENGIVIIVFEDLVYGTNSDDIPTKVMITDAFTPDFVDAVDLSIETEEMQRVIIGGVTASDAQSKDVAFVNDVTPEIAYLYASEIPTSYAVGDGEEVAFTEKVIVMQTYDQVFAKRSTVMVWMTASSFVLLLAVFAIVFQLLNRVIARRIDEENEALALVTAGKLDTRAMAGGTREFESLSEGINETVDALKGWITEAETRMDAELATARIIQESALPRTFPPYPDIMKFDIYATMKAAKEVGGDFYDYFLIGDDCGSHSGKLGFVVADVSGKGVPAALFMMKAKALLRDYVASGMELGEAVTEVNRQLVEGNDAGMFVTVWVGVLDYGTGHVDYVNAGHNPPLLWQGEGGWRWLRQKSGPVLGLFEMPYRAYSIECLPGDTFLLYTDGVTEAFNVEDQLYGETRLLAVAEEGFWLHPRDLLQAVRSDVAAYAQGAEQSDDITILALEVGVPPEITATLELPAVVGELDRVNEFLHVELDSRLCPQRVQNQLDIAVEELFVNVCRYAYPEATEDSPGTVRIQRTYTSDPQSITVDIIDSGIPYDPLAKPDAVTPTDIKDVPIGGLGILMAKRCSDEMRYERAGDNNIVTIVKKW